MTQENNGEVTDVMGAAKILGISRATLYHWEKRNLVKSFTSAYNGRMKKCFLVSDLNKLAGQGSQL
ncbi:hypothetical protein LCGC14_1463980 [marine sediment metagenome]|uniref:HTH merR-type domain-containing protein n=1 Tax=marine sediment metagenome TaxID=412755 RepID=A0A0F9JES1_9ZZZZ